MGEFELIEHYFAGVGASSRSAAGVLVGIGDDCAVVDWPGPLAIATDTMVAGVHFPDHLDPASIAHRCLAANLSDLAAMGAQPLGFTLALTLPHAAEDWLAEFAAGLRALAERFDVVLLGGDTTRGPLTVTIQIVGRAPSEGLLTRAGAADGDAIFVTGTLGGAIAGLAALEVESPSTHESFWIERFTRPTPRVAVARRLAGVASAAIDISDGLLADLGHIASASGCGAALDLERLPLAPGLVDDLGEAQALEYGMCGGDDYELCFTVPRQLAGVVDEIAGDERLSIAQVGQMTAASAGVRCTLRGTEWLPSSGSGGYEHFQRV